MADPAGYFKANAVLQENLSGLPWVILSPERFAIKQQVETQGLPLKQWDISIYRGVLTGFNDAFYLTQEQRDAFVAQDPNCVKYLVPLLRGRYVSRYATDWDGTWMINSHNGVKSKGIPPVDLKRECPVLWQHLAQYEKQLSKRQDKGDHWSNLRNCAYVDEFKKSKIMYPNMTKFLPFYYDAEDGIFGNQKCFIITSEENNLTYLTAFLNSALFKCCFRDNFPELMGNTYEVSKIFVDIIPVKKPSPAETEFYEKLVPLVQAAKKTALEEPTNLLEPLIDACVMECYFREHMAERDLLFHDTVAEALHDYNSDATETAQLAYIETFHQRLIEAKIPERIARIPEASPDLLGVILKEGKV
jgi:hypothetical protein